MDQEAALKEIVSGKILRLLAYNGSFTWTGVRVADAAPRWRGPANILEIDDAGETVESQTFKVARYCVRRKVGAQDAGDMGWNPASTGFGCFGQHAVGGVGEEPGERSVVFVLGRGPY